MPDHATLELHFINVGQGDSILLVNRNLDALARAVRAKAGTTAFNQMPPLDHLPYATAQGVDLLGTVNQALLIDGGDDEYGGNVVDYLEQQGVLNPRAKGFVANLEVLITHYHDDHIGGVRSVFKELVEEQVPTQVAVGRGKNKKTKTVMKTVRRLEERYRPARVYLTTPDSTEDPASVRLTNLRADIATARGKTTNPTVETRVDPGGLVGNRQLQISLGTGVNGIPITLKAFAAARTVYNPATHTITAIESGTRTPDQNDRSIVLILQYGSFRCYLGGDIAGDGGADGGNTGGNAVVAGTKRFFSNHADVETDLNAVLEENLPATAVPEANKPKFTVPANCTVLKANHHASSSSVDVYTLSTTRPRIAVVPAGVKARFHRHPTQEVLNRMSPTETEEWDTRPGSAVTGPVDNTLTGIYVTEIADKYKKKAFGVDAREALIVGDMIVRPTDESVSAIQAATAFGTALTVQVYATGEQTGVGGDTALRDVDNGTSTPPYPIGPFIHTCDLH